MKQKLLDSAVFLGAAIWLCLGQAEAGAQTKTAIASPMRLYKGAWFDVRYPAAFTASPPSRTASSQNGGNEATLSSPDWRVQFYVFAPQWNGDSAFITVKPGEKQISKTVDTRKSSSGVYSTTVKWITVEAKDKSYTRTWEDSETTLNTRRVVGIKYKTEADFKKYHSQYLAFKNSLQQYGD